MIIEDLMIRIRNVLAEFKHNGENIEDIKLFENLENNLVITYNENGQKYLINIEECE